MLKLVTSRLFRCTLCLILVCCLVVSWSPIRVQASALPEVAGVVTKIIPFNPSSAAGAAGAALGSQVFGYVLLGLGLIVTTAQAIELMNAYSEFSGELETSIYYYPDGTWSYGVDMGFVERVRAFLFDSGYIICNPNFVLATSQTVLCAGLEYVVSADTPFAVVGLYWGSGGRASRTDFYAFAPSLGGFAVNGTYKGATDYGYYKAVSFFTSGADDNPSSTSTVPIVEVPDLTNDTIAAFFGNEIPVEYVTTIDGVEVGTIAPPEVDIPNGYPEWYTNARPATNPDTQEEITVLPTPLDPNTDTIPDGVTQPDTWQGSIADPMPDTGTDTDPDTGTDTDPDSGTSGDGSNRPIDDFQVDLTSFFPFCIPFDLYEFIRILCAEPEAPVFHWEVQDLSGNVYSVDVDLSPWNSHAQLFRDAQCLLFIIGLLMLTRKFIKW